MRSVVVVLPASMWAMIPMLRTRSSAILVSAVAIGSPSLRLPAVVRERLVGLRHPVEVVLTLVGTALLVESVQDLPRELLVHVLLAPVARVRNDPAHGEGACTARRHLDRNLVVRPADTPRARLQHGGDGLDRLLQNLDRRLPGLLADAVQRLVDDALGGRLLALRHHAVDHLRDEAGAVHGVRVGLADLNLCTARHLAHCPRFAPYLERPWRRSETPAVSRAARMTL